jgi:glutamyl/glutaminyl-tRNA synthetase
MVIIEQGYLHIGHAKSMNLNFSYPKKSGGHTYLRFDDTNPEAEKGEYFENIVKVLNTLITLSLNECRMWSGWDTSHGK